MCDGVSCKCHKPLEARMTAFDYLSPEMAAFREREAFRRPLIDKVYAQYGRGLITSVELLEMLTEISTKTPPPRDTRTTVTMLVTVRLDPVPGAMHTPKDAQDTVRSILTDRIKHYNPEVDHVTIQGA